MRVSKPFLVSLTAASLAALAGCGPGADGPASTRAAVSSTSVHPESPGRKKFLTVMTRNVYVGADLFEPFQSEDPLGTAAKVWAEIQASDFASRAGAIAEEIAGASPDLVALQEVYRFVVTPLGATEPVLQELDYLALLMEKLAPGRWRVAAAQPQTDLLIPFPGLGVQIRIVDRDVILADVGVDVLATDSGNFAAHFETTLGGVVDVVVKRGWVEAVVRKEGLTTTLVNTHLEGKEFGPLQSLQAGELALRVGGVEPLVVVGDTNSDPGDPPYTIPGPNPGDPPTVVPTPYQILTGSLADTWIQAGEGPGLTCCFDADIAPPSRALYERVDLVLLRGAVTPKAAWRVGLDPLATLGDRWPSDHAGVIGILRFDDTSELLAEVE